MALVEWSEVPCGGLSRGLREEWRTYGPRCQKGHTPSESISLHPLKYYYQRVGLQARPDLRAYLRKAP